MLSAFTARPIVELKQRDKSKIESILAHGDRLFVGLNTGSLRIYRVNELPPPYETAPLEQCADQSGGTDGQPQQKQSGADLLREQEKFSRYKIDQLAIIKEANILLSLSGTYVSIHDLATYKLQEQLTKTKGASTFAVTSNVVKDESTGIPSLVSRLAVAVKRRLLLWSWQDMELAGDAVEIALSSSIKTLTWATGTKIVAGLSSNYAMVDVETQGVETIQGPGSIGGVPGQEGGRLGAGTMSYIGMGGYMPKPLATRLGEGEILLAKDVNTHFIGTDGKPLGRRQIPWAGAPEAIGYSYPYLLALQDATKGILEVRNPETLNLLQSISLPAANLLQVAQPNISLAHAGKGFLVASDRVIWRMGALDYDSQIDALVEADQLDEAISLLGMLEDALVRDKEGRLREIKMQKAQRLFDMKRYRASLDLFTEVAAPPERVIKLYPEGIAGDLAVKRIEEETAQHDEDPKPQSEDDNDAKEGSSQESLKSPKQPANPALTSLKDTSDDKNETASVRSHDATDGGPSNEKELKAAVRELQAFLADVRRRLKRFFNEDNSLKKEDEIQVNGDTDEADRIIAYLIGADVDENIDRGQRLKEVATLVDTTLFRAHMYATPSLAGSLFRIANFCDPDVVMEKLEETGRYNDLVDFLFGKKLHRQALERLQKFGKAETPAESAPQLHGPTRTIYYLQGLPPEMIDLILEFAEWPIREDPKNGMEIFIADTENAEKLDRSKVLRFLEKIDLGLAIQYLEHVIDELDDMTPDLHQRLCILYFERVSDTAQDSPSFNPLHQKFLTLLQESEQYSPAKILGILPRDNPIFYEARAIVFSKMGQHKQALEIYVFKLESPAKAEEYCNHVHLTEDTVATKVAPSRRVSTTDPIEDQPSIYHILLNLYLNPPFGYKPLWQPAIELLARHGSRLPASSTLNLIPSTLPVKDLEFYFRGRIRAAETIMGEGRIVAGLRKVEAVRVQEKLLLGIDGRRVIGGGGGRSRRVKVDEERVCGVCHKRLGGSVISVFPE
ncbi:hypothetical protein UCRPC4_g00994 [Phaeomoniella chlamydospora]|uniref:CNH domain-containing protein n=1 Tax=Phaeomoniella chlamydospora TaxID=158046 RepID=A0A0G2EY66_PHACM|nr:hypothetical protein UCRPC4_g00994 [Phaeomoniella chlamydospora]